MPDTTAATEEAGPPREAPPMSAAEALDHRFEIYEAILLAVAALLTAWAAFQATKWGGVQADSYSRAGAARTESTRASTRAGQLTGVDVNSFTSWVAAIGSERRAGIDDGFAADGTYIPEPGTESGFLYARFRPEFRTAVDAWLATTPLTNPSAPPTPFAMPEYKVADAARADELELQAESLAATARKANQDGDNYVLMTILFASVLVLVGIGSKMDTLGARSLLFGLACTILIGAGVVILTFPVEL